MSSKNAFIKAAATNFYNSGEQNQLDTTPPLGSDEYNRRYRAKYTRMHQRVDLIVAASGGDAVCAAEHLRAADTRAVAIGLGPGSVRYLSENGAALTGFPVYGPNENGLVDVVRGKYVVATCDLPTQVIDAAASVYRVYVTRARFTLNEPEPQKESLMTPKTDTPAIGELTATLLPHVGESPYRDDAALGGIWDVRAADLDAVRRDDLSTMLRDDRLVDLVVADTVEEALAIGKALTFTDTAVEQCVDDTGTRLRFDDGLNEAYLRVLIGNEALAFNETASGAGGMFVVRGKHVVGNLLSASRSGSPDADRIAACKSYTPVKFERAKAEEVKAEEVKADPAAQSADPRKIVAEMDAKLFELFGLVHGLSAAADRTYKPGDAVWVRKRREGEETERKGKVLDAPGDFECYGIYSVHVDYGSVLVAASHMRPYDGPA